MNQPLPALKRLRPAKINFYLRFMQGRGFSAAQVLEGTGISPHQLADPHYLVEISDYIRIIANIRRLANSPSLAFALGEQLTLGDLGILGYCVMSCDNTDEATKLWHEYNPVFFGNLIEVMFEKTGNQMLLTHIPLNGIRADLLQFLIEEKICYDMALQRLIGLDKFHAFMGQRAGIAAAWARPRNPCALPEIAQRCIRQRQRRRQPVAQGQGDPLRKPRPQPAYF
jgi:hypothetical protein